MARAASCWGAYTGLLRPFREELNRGGSMIAAFDVAYDETENTALAAAVVFDQWSSATCLQQQTKRIDSISPYEPGEFYKRELPCLMPLVDWAVGQHDVTTLVIDGFVDLGPERPGLGRHLASKLATQLEVIGVAKRPFKGRPGVAVKRGASEDPLWVTSTHSDTQAARNVQSMHGSYRVPAMLKLVDSLSRGRT